MTQKENTQEKQNETNDQMIEKTLDLVKRKGGWFTITLSSGKQYCVSLFLKGHGAVSISDSLSKSVFTCIVKLQEMIDLEKESKILKEPLTNKNKSV